MMKNGIYFILKDIFVLEMLKFYIDWSCRKNGLVRKIRLISELMTSQRG